MRPTGRWLTVSNQRPRGCASKLPPRARTMRPFWDRRLRACDGHVDPLERPTLLGRRCRCVGGRFDRRRVLVGAESTEPRGTAPGCKAKRSLRCSTGGRCRPASHRPVNASPSRERHALDRRVHERGPLPLGPCVAPGPDAGWLCASLGVGADLCASPLAADACPRSTTRRERARLRGSSTRQGSPGREMPAPGPDLSECAGQPRVGRCPWRAIHRGLQRPQGIPSAVRSAGSSTARSLCARCARRSGPSLVGLRGVVERPILGRPRR